MFPKAPILLTNIGKIKSTIIMIVSWKKGIQGECLTKGKKKLQKHIKYSFCKQITLVFVIR